MMALVPVARPLVMIFGLGAALSCRPERLTAADLAGVWVFVGSPEKVGPIPADGRRLLFIAGSSWTVTNADPWTKEVVNHHGGSFVLLGDHYRETVQYGTALMMRLVDQQFVFKVSIEGDLLTKIGLGNRYREVWRRLPEGQ
jgi:hypothetical protein